MSQFDKQEYINNNLTDFGMPNLPQVSSRIQCISIIGQIEGHMLLSSQNKTTKYEHILPQLVAIAQDKDVESGLAIAEGIAELPKPVVTVVLGGGHSIGVPIATAGNYSFIAPSASMTIHPVRLTGMVIGVPATMEYIERMQDRVVDFVVSHSKISDAEFRRLMFTVGELSQDIGTVVVGERAVKCGLIDEVGSIRQAMSKIDELIEEAKK